MKIARIIISVLAERCVMWLLQWESNAASVNACARNVSVQWTIQIKMSDSFLSFTEATKNILLFAHHSVSVSNEAGFLSKGQRRRRWRRRRRKRSVSNVKNTIEPHFSLSTRFHCEMPRLLWARTTSSLSLSRSYAMYGSYKTVNRLVLSTDRFIHWTVKIQNDASAQFSLWIQGAKKFSSQF